MKHKILNPLILLVLGIFIGGTLIRCTSNTGIGNDKSDFDESKYYTKEEINTLLAGYCTLIELNTSLLNYYSQTEVDTLFTDYYSKSEIDTTLADYCTLTELDDSLLDYYNQSEIELLLTDYYAKSEIDTILTDYYTQSEIDASHYTQTEVDNLLAQYYEQSEIDTLISNSKSSILFGRTNAGAGATVFSMFHVESNEVSASISIPADGVLKNLYVHATSINGTTWSVTVTVRVNGASTDLYVDYPSTTGTDVLSNTSDVITVNQGDLVSIQFTETGGVNSPPFINANFLFDTEI